MIEGGNWPTNNKSSAKKLKVVTLEWKFKFDVNDVIKEIADCKNIHIASILCVLELSKGEIINRNEEYNSNEKDEDISEKIHWPKTSH